MQVGDPRMEKMEEQAKKNNNNNNNNNWTIGFLRSQIQLKRKVRHFKIIYPKLFGNINYKEL